MQLPHSVQYEIDERAGGVSFSVLSDAAQALSDAYRAGRPAAISNAERLTAYLVTRMPATYAAAHAVLGEVSRRLGDRPVSSVLDLGAGTGAAALAARSWFPQARLTLLERDPAMAGAARQWLPEASLLPRDFGRADQLPPHDLVIACYSLSEICGPGAALPAGLAERLWRAAGVALVVLEPGVPSNFALVRSLRDELLSAGAHMIAPCPGPVPCPMSGGDWCHFAARVERSSLHRRLKGGELGYEDEKYSYVALARDPVETAAARVIRRPVHRPGLIVLETCTPQGLRTASVRKRERDLFRAARHASWGSELPGV